MDAITLQDERQRLVIAVDDLKAISSVILTVVNHEKYANAYEVLKVISRALTPIIDDIQEAINEIGAELKK